MSYFEIFSKILPGIAQVLLGVAAIIAAWKGRKTAKETIDGKAKD